MAWTWFAEKKKKNFDKNNVSLRSKETLLSFLVSDDVNFIKCLYFLIYNYFYSFQASVGYKTDTGRILKIPTYL